MGNTISVKKINFEDMQFACCNSNNFIIINTLDINNQSCLIKNTIQPSKEIELLNHYLSKDKEVNIVIYGINSSDETIYKKYEQLSKLGFYSIFIYPGGLLEWLLLQEVYGDEEFPTTSKLLDILKYKGQKFFGIPMLKN
jgi:hypothetical protein